MNEDDRIRALAKAIYRDKVLVARRTRPVEKLFGGVRLFEEVCERMRCGIRGQFPGLDNEGVERELRRRIAVNKRLEMVRCEMTKPSSA